MLNRVARFLAGSDIFFSYRWRGRNKSYGLRLIEELEKRGLNCYIDEKGLSRGEFVTKALERAITRSRMFVVLLTDDIKESTWVPQEMSIAHKRRRKIVPVNVNGMMKQLSLEDPRWSALRDRSRVEESQEALDNMSPSPHVIQQIDEAFRFTRQRVIATRILFGVGTVFFVLSVVAAASAVGVIQIRNSAEQQIAVLKAQETKLTTDSAVALQGKKKAESYTRDALLASEGAKAEQIRIEPFVRFQPLGSL